MSKKNLDNLLKGSKSNFCFLGKEVVLVQNTKNGIGEKVTGIIRNFAQGYLSLEISSELLWQRFPIGSAEGRWMIFPKNKEKESKCLTLTFSQAPKAVPTPEQIKRMQRCECGPALDYDNIAFDGDVLPGDMDGNVEGVDSMDVFEQQEIEAEMIQLVFRGQIFAPVELDT